MAKSRKRGRNVLTIQQIFQLLAILNGIVLVALLVSSWQLLLDRTSSQQHAITTIFLALLLAIMLGISYRIVALRVVRPLSRLVFQSHALAADHYPPPVVPGCHGGKRRRRPLGQGLQWCVAAPSSGD